MLKSFPSSSSALLSLIKKEYYNLRIMARGKPISFELIKSQINLKGRSKDNSDYLQGAKWEKGGLGVKLENNQGLFECVTAESDQPSKD